MTAHRLRTNLAFSCAALLVSGAAGCSRPASAAEPATFRGIYEGSGS